MRRKGYVWALCMALEFFVPQVAWAQSIQIKGIVRDQTDGAELIGAHLILLSDWEQSTITDVSGHFALRASMNDTLVVSYMGYEEQLVPVAGQSTVEVFLIPKTTQIAPVQITSDRLIAEDFTVTKLNRLDIYKNPNAKADPLLAVNGSPAVTTTDESANISFRGSGPGETGIFLNQVPVYDAVRFSQLNGIGTFSIFNTELASSVHVFPGNPPLEYGNTTSGLISINTRDQVQAGSSQISLSMANFGFFHGSELGRKERTSLILYGNYQPSAVLIAVNPTALRQIPWFQAIDGGLQVSHQFDGNAHLKVFNYTLSEGYDFNFRSPTYLGTFKQRKLRNMTILNYRKGLYDGILSVNAGWNQSNARLHYSQFDYHLDNEDQYLSINYHKEKYRLEWKFGAAADNRVRGFDGQVPQYDFALGSEHPSIMITTNQSRLIVDGFTYLKYRPSDKISFGYAVRSNVPITTRDVKIGRQSVVNFAPTQYHRVIMASGTYHRYDWIDNQELGWISSKQFSLDYQYESADWRWTLSAYTKRNSRQELETDVFGVETYFRYRPGRKFYWDFSYSFIDVEESAPGGSRPGIYDLNYFIRSGIEYAFAPYWTLSGRMLWRQGVYHNSINEIIYRDDLNVFEPTFFPIAHTSDRLPYYQIIDVNLSRLFTIGEAMQGVVYGSVSNLLNRENVRGYTYDFTYEKPQQELLGLRTFYVGLVLTFQ